MQKTKIKKFCETLIDSVDTELKRERGYGCVNYFSNGSHDDMDYRTFLNSANAISNSLKKINTDDLKDLNSLRKFGVSVEKEMMDATNGVNTHRGFIFLILFIFREYLIGTEYKNLNKSISEFSKELSSDYLQPKNSALLKKDGIADIRTFPMSGFSFVTDFISKIEKNPSFWNEDKKTLYLLSKVDDTTTIKRSDIETLRKLQKLAKKALLSDEVYLAKDLDNYYITNKISSGGVADILTVSNILLKLKGDFDGKTMG